MERHLKQPGRKKTGRAFFQPFFFCAVFPLPFSDVLWLDVHFVTPRYTFIIHLCLCVLYSYCFAPPPLFFSCSVSGVIHFNASNFTSKRRLSAVDCQHTHKYHFLSCFCQKYFLPFPFRSVLFFSMERMLSTRMD